MQKRHGGLVLAAMASMLGGCPTLPFEPPPIGEPFVRPVDGSFMDPRIAGEPVTLAETPPPIAGGTLTVLARGAAAIVADPDRDRVLVVDLVARAVTGEVTLPRGAEPGRVIEDGAGRVHVALRGTGEVLSFDPERPEASTRRAVCAMPRGLAYDASADALLVACREGVLATLPAGEGAPTRTVTVDRDLRDVVVRNAGVFVTRFRSAELLRLDQDGQVLARTTPRPADAFGPAFSEGDVGLPRAGAARDVGPTSATPSVAWRAVPISAPLGSGEGEGTLVVHQRGRASTIEPAPGGYGASSPSCDAGIVSSALTVFDAAGTARGGATLSGATLPVDVAVSPATSGDMWFTVIAAGNESGKRSVLSYRRTEVEFSDPSGCLTASSEAEVPNATSAAYTPGGTLVVLRRDPAVLVLFEHGDGGGLLETGRIALGGAPRFDTGHAIFHANSGAFMACASCHPEGGDDGRVWSFAGLGPLRTPAMNGHLIGTEPFHWTGDMNDLGHLMDDVFRGRMNGPALAAYQVDALGGWLDALHPPAAAAPSEASERGRALFEGEAACASCHGGALLTNSYTVDVGTGGRFQVPSLVGVSHRLPVMHDGCADTLRARFDEACGGGDAHGHTSQLDEAQLADLVAYMETL